MRTITAGGPLRSFRMRRQRARRWHRADTFLSHAIVLEEHPAPGFLRWVMLGVLGLVVGFLTWAAMVSIPERAWVAGEVQSSRRAQPVLSNDAGTIAELLVRDGQLVQAGEPLMRLDTRELDVELNRLTVKAGALSMDLERLSALLAGRRPQFEQVAEVSPEVLVAQSALFDTRLAVEANRRVALDIELATLESEIASHQRQMVSAELRRAAAEAERDLHERLRVSGMLPRIQLPEVELRHATASDEIRKHVSDLERLDSALRAKRKQIEDFDVRIRAEYQAEYDAALNAKDEVQSAIGQLTRQLAHSSIVAPESGVVLVGALTRVGGVIAASTEVAQVAPVDEAILVGAHIAPRDLFLVAPGDAATIRFPALEAAMLDEFQGRLEELSPSIATGANGPVYRASFRVGPENLHGEGLAVRPGMVAQVKFHSRRRSFLEFLAEPIRDLADRFI